jgi:hypothetical protein
VKLEGKFVKAITFPVAEIQKWKPVDLMEAGYVFSPYIPMQVTELDFGNNIGKGRSLELGGRRGKDQTR